MAWSKRAGAALGFLTGSTFACGISYLFRPYPEFLMLLVLAGGMVGAMAGASIVTALRRCSRESG